MVDNYADSTNLGYLYASITDSVSSNLSTYALTVADNYILSKIEGISKTNPPASIQMAAEFKAMAFILRSLTDVDEGDMPTADYYEREADKLIGSYAAQNATEESEIHPYSSSKTPNSTYLKTTDPYLNITPNFFYAIDENGLRVLKRSVLNGDNNAWKPGE
jgi:hypothetical protein